MIAAELWLGILIGLVRLRPVLNRHDCEFTFSRATDASSEFPTR